MDLIVEHADPAYGQEVVRLLELYENKFEAHNNQRNLYIAQHLLAVIEPFTICVFEGGTRVTGKNECEQVDRATCIEMDGIYDECVSPCRHDLDGDVCIESCVSVCHSFVAAERYETMIGKIITVASTQRSCPDSENDEQTCYLISDSSTPGRQLYPDEIVGFDREKGYTYTLRVEETTGYLSLLELIDKEVDLDLCTTYFDGCNTCTIRDGEVQSCSNVYCKPENLQPEACLETN
jgi:hypothetical protein